MIRKRNVIDYIYLFLFILLNIAFLLSCNPDATQTEMAIEPTPGNLTESTPQPSTKATNTVTPTPTKQVIITPPPNPTRTPFTYSVAEDDTMLGIALRYGIELDALKAANPEVDPNFMSIGTVLIIPLDDGSDEQTATSAEFEIDLPQPVCHPAGESHIWCVVTFENPFDQAIENLSANITLFSKEQEVLDSGIAFSLVRVIYPGEIIPLYYRFKYPGEGEYLSTAAISSGFFGQNTGERYIQYEIESIETIIVDSGNSSTTYAVIDFVEPDSISGFWLAAAGFDSSGNAAAFRKIRISSLTGNPAEFAITLYSLGPEIADVKLYVEELKEPDGE